MNASLVDHLLQVAETVARDAVSDDEPLGFDAESKVSEVSAEQVVVHVVLRAIGSEGVPDARHFKTDVHFVLRGSIQLGTERWVPVSPVRVH